MARSVWPELTDSDELLSRTKDEDDDEDDLARDANLDSDRSDELPRPLVRYTDRRTHMTHEHDNLETDAPRGLRDGLRALYGAAPDVPDELDRAILSEARRRLPRWRLITLRRLMPLAAAAAVLVVAGVALVRMQGPRAPEAARAAVARRAVETPPAAMEDIDGDGRVDILDAFALARRVESGREPSRRHDLNRDGRVDRADVELVAAAAVRLNGRRSG
jgi:hypothetical protein